MFPSSHPYESCRDTTISPLTWSTDWTSLLQADVETLLHHEPVTTCLPLLFGLGELEVVLQEEGGDEF